MTDITVNIVTDIAHHHAQALTKAGEAVAHAQQVGKLLQQVKDTLGHGQWLPWLAENVSFSPRQAQRYLQVAAGRPLPIRAKAKATASASHLESRPSFVPESTSCYIYSTGAGQTFVVEPSVDHRGFFFVSRLDACTAERNYTRRPVRSDWVQFVLKDFGLQDPVAAAWRASNSAGVLEALGTFEEVSA